MPHQVTSKNWHQFFCLILSKLQPITVVKLLANADRLVHNLKHCISNENGTSIKLILWYVLLKFMSQEEWLSIGNTNIMKNSSI